MSKRARRLKALRRRLEAIHRNYKPKFGKGDILIPKIHKGPSIEIIAIVADQYKYLADNQELPLYEFTEIIDTIYEEV